MLIIKLLILSFSALAYDSSIAVKKSGDKKIFKTTVKTSFKGKLIDVAKGIENFDDKCNNERRSKRKFSKWEKNCSYHNENLVEAVKIQKFSNELLKHYPHAKYLMWRNIYNRGRFSHYDVITKKVEQNKIIITHQKLPEDLVRKILPKPEKIVSAFDDIKGTYTLTQIKPNLVQVTYIYESATDHWFLTKDFLEKNIKKNMVQGSEQAVKSIELSLKRSRIL